MVRMGLGVLWGLGWIDWDLGSYATLGGKNGAWGARMGVWGRHEVGLGSL